MRKERFQYKNWIIIIDKNILGSLRARASIINKSDFIFKLSADKQRTSEGYPGTKKIPAGSAGFGDRFTLRSNTAETAQAFFRDKVFKALLEELPEFEFFIKDEDGRFPFFSLVFPEEADVLTLKVSGRLRKKSLKHNAVNIFKKALDILVSMDVLDPDNEPIGRF